MTGPSAATAPASSIARSATAQRPFLAWIYAPTPEAFFFSLRTSLAACIALAIAFWMELDSPAWAAMTVWSVAQLTRGESLSKAHWRMIGTFIGACAAITLMSLAPQGPWLVFPMIALWIGLCSGMATFVSNFRSYAFVLAGYTCSIICSDALHDANTIFFVAVARSTYIVLGVVCEATIASLFTIGLEHAARLQLKAKLEEALILVSHTLKKILAGEHSALAAARHQFGSLLQANDKIEFAEIEMGNHGHEGDHARAALAATSVLLSRGFGMATRLRFLHHNHDDFTTITTEVLSFLHNFHHRLSVESDIPDLLADLQHLRAICVQYGVPHRLRTEIPTSGPVVLSQAEVQQLQTEKSAELTTSDLDERVLFIALGELLADLERAITEYYASVHTVRRDHFHFRNNPHRDPKLAFNNGVRGALAVLVTALIYEVTAWPQGQTFIGLTSLICGLYATRDNPVLGTLSFLKGTIMACCMAWILVFLLIPAAHSYEALVLVLGGAMFLGGLAKANPSTAGGAAAYCLLMPLMLGLQNHHIMDEVSFYNTNLAILMGAVVSVIVFRSILPFNSADERFRMRRAMLHELRALARPDTFPAIRIWVGHNTDRFSRMLRHAGNTQTPLIEAFLQGTLATLTLGINIIRLRTLMDREYLPESARRPIALVMHYIEISHNRHDRVARIADAAIRRLRELDTSEHEMIVRLEMTRAITYLVVIAATLKTNRHFLDASAPFRGEDTLLAGSA